MAPPVGDGTTSTDLDLGTMVIIDDSDEEDDTGTMKREST